MNQVSSSTGVSIVLVHGGFVDGSGWEGVYQILKKDGYSVAIVQNPTDVAGRRCRGDEARHRSTGWSRDPRWPFVWWRCDHRSGQRPKVAALVYIAAFAPDRGESVLR